MKTILNRLINTSIALAFGKALMFAGSATITLSMVTTTPVFAQEQIIEEIVVTARKRSESIMDVPVAIFGITGGDLAKFSKTDIRDLEANVPGMVVHAGGSGAGGSVAIRGVSTSPTQFGFEQAVSVAVDGIQVGRARILTAGMLDVQQVEVMKGPQTLFFGKNSPGGVLSIQSKNPGAEVDGYFKGSYETEADESKFEGVFTIPVNDNFGMRFAASHRKMDGWANNTANRTLTREEMNFATICAIAGGVLCPIPVPPDGVRTSDLEGLPTLGRSTQGSEELIGRATFLWQPSDNFTANLKITASSYEDDGPTMAQQVFDCAGAAASEVRGVIDPFGDCEIDEDYSTGGLPIGVADNYPDAKRLPYSELDNTLVSLNLEYVLGDWTVTSVTGYYDSEFDSYDDYTASPTHQISTTQGEDYELFTQELRLASDLDSPLNYMVGAYYSDSDLLATAHTKLFAFGADPATGKHHTWEKPAVTEASTWSVFAQVIWDINEQWELAGGVRYTDEEKDSFIRHDYIHPFAAVFGAAPTGRDFTNDFEDDNLSPEVTLTWHVTDNVTAYGSYKTGFKSGGAALSVVLLGYDYGRIAEPGYDQEYINGLGFGFESEEVESFEIGLKSTLMDNKVALNISAYTYDYTDLQVTAWDSRALAFTISNAADASVDGIELDISYMASDALKLYAAVNYNKAEYEDFVTGCSAGQTVLGFPGCFVDPVSGASLQNLKGAPLTRAPEWSANVGFDYYHQIREGIELSLSANARFSDEYNVVDDGDPRAIQPSFWIFDAAARVSWLDSGFYASLIGRNLGDEFYVTRIVDKPGQSIGQLSASEVRRGRQIALEVGYEF